MSRLRQTVAGILGTLVVAVTPMANTGSATASTPVAASTAVVPSVLYAGQRLTASGSRDSLRNGEFSLTVGSDNVTLEQTLILNGPDGPVPLVQGTWFRDDQTGAHQANHDRSTLTMRTNGNLVLADSHGTVLWTSHTRGTGSHNRLVLGPGGNMVIRTGANRVVWSSHSGAVSLPAGRGLASGQRMINAWGSHGTNYRPHTLTMQADGNLVRRCGKHVLWQSHTHVAGSRLWLRMDGGLVILSRSDRTVWSAHSGGHDSYAYFDMFDVSVRDATFMDKTLWQAKYPFYPC